MLKILSYYSRYKNIQYRNKKLQCDICKTNFFKHREAHRVLEDNVYCIYCFKVRQNNNKDEFYKWLAGMK